MPTTDVSDAAATGVAHTEDPADSMITNNPVSNHLGNPTNVTLAPTKPSPLTAARHDAGDSRIPVAKPGWSGTLQSGTGADNNPILGPNTQAHVRVPQFGQSRLDR